MMEKCCARLPPDVNSAGEETGKDVSAKGEMTTTRTVDGIGKCPSIFQKFIRGGLEEGKIMLIIVELWVGGLWRWCKNGGKDGERS